MSFPVQLASRCYPHTYSANEGPNVSWGGGGDSEFGDFDRTQTQCICHQCRCQSPTHSNVHIKRGPVLLERPNGCEQSSPPILPTLWSLEQAAPGYPGRQCTARSFLWLASGSPARSLLASERCGNEGNCVITKQLGGQRGGLRSTDKQGIQRRDGAWSPHRPGLL